MSYSSAVEARTKLIRTDTKIYIHRDMSRSTETMSPFPPPNMNYQM